MELTALLCNHAEVAEGKLYVSGGAISNFEAQGGGPYPISVAVAVVVRTPWTQTNQEFEIRIALLDEDGRAVVPWTPPGTPQPPPFEFGTTLTVGRPPGLPPGTEQSVPLAFNLPGLPLQAAGSYAFIVTVNREEKARLPFRLVS